MTEFEKLVDSMPSEQYMKLFDFGTGDKYKPDEKTEKLTDEQILKELGL